MGGNRSWRCYSCSAAVTIGFLLAGCGGGGDGGDGGGGLDAEPATIVLSQIDDLAIDEDATTAAQAFSSDEPDATFSATSSDEVLVPVAGIQLGGSNGDHTITLIPGTDQFGIATITITATAPGRSGTTSFDLTVRPVNDTPVLTAPTAANGNEDAEIVFDGTISIDDVDDEVLENVELVATNGQLRLATVVGLVFTLGDGRDDTTMAFSGTVEAVNTALDGATVVPEPEYIGQASLDVAVSDGLEMASTTIAIDVAAVNDAPVITTSDALDTLAVNTQRTIRFSVGDVDVTGAQEVEVTLGIDSGGALALPTRDGLSFSTGTGTGGEAQVVFRGTLAEVNAALQSGGIELTPMTGFTGDLTFVAAVSDLGSTGAGGAVVTPAEWVTTYSNSNTTPTVSGIADRSIPENTAGGDTASFTVGDGQTAASHLMVTASHSPDVSDPVNVTLTVKGTGANRTVTAIPITNDSGETTITITVSDGVLSATEIYVLTVTPLAAAASP